MTEIPGAIYMLITQRAAEFQTRVDTLERRVTATSLEIVHAQPFQAAEIHARRRADAVQARFEVAEALFEAEKVMLA